MPDLDLHTNAAATLAARVTVALVGPDGAPYDAAGLAAELGTTVRTGATYGPVVVQAEAPGDATGEFVFVLDGDEVAAAAGRPYQVWASGPDRSLGVVASGAYRSSRVAADGEPGADAPQRVRIEVTVDPDGDVVSARAVLVPGPQGDPGPGVVVVADRDAALAASAANPGVIYGWPQ